MSGRQCPHNMHQETSAHLGQPLGLYNKHIRNILVQIFFFHFTALEYRNENKLLIWLSDVINYILKSYWVTGN